MNAFLREVHWPQSQSRTRFFLVTISTRADSSNSCFSGCTASSRANKSQQLHVNSYNAFETRSAFIGSRVSMLAVHTKQNTKQQLIIRHDQRHYPGALQAMWSHLRQRALQKLVRPEEDGSL